MNDLNLTDKELQRLSGLYPALGSLIVQVLQELNNVFQLRFYVLSGLRTYEQQEECYSKGRELKDGFWIVTNEKEIVTNAKPGYSWHNYGLAADLVLDLDAGHPGVKLTWQEIVDSNKDGANDWLTLGMAVMSNGLIWGGSFKTIKDVPHVELHPGIEIKDALATYTSTKKLQAVWDSLKSI